MRICLGTRSWRGVWLCLVVVSTLVFFLVFRSATLEGEHKAEDWRRDRRRHGPFSGYKDCSPVTKVAFLKTHKCASSSIQNILLRAALKRKLNVVLPLTGNYVGRYMPFHRSVLWGTPWHAAGLTYDVFCLHTIWNLAEVANVMGGDTTYFTILRDPVDLFVSLWDYAQFQTYYRVTLEEYVMEADKASPLFRDRSKLTNLGRNQMLWDLGLPASDFDDTTKVRQKIAEVERTFDLVLIAERFDESMVLLKHLLCWNFEDVTALRVNAQRSSTKSTLSPQARRVLKQWLAADYMLYDHFVANFEAALQAFGEHEMEQELLILRHANGRVRERCGVVEADNAELSGESKLWGKNMVGYRVESDDDFCRFYAISEMAFLDHLRRMQGERAERVLAEQNRTLDDADSFLGVHDPFRPVFHVKKPDGSPDIEALKKIYRHVGKTD